MTDHPISRVAIIGTGQMGPTIAVATTLAGLPDHPDWLHRRVQSVEARAPWGPVMGSTALSFEDWVAGCMG